MAKPIKELFGFEPDSLEAFAQASQMPVLDRVVWANKGGLAEQFVGQHLRCLFRSFEEPRLFYWQRAEGRQGEVDYIIQQGSRVVPIEVKAGSAGSMKSLHAFMHNKQLPLAVRFDTNPPSVQDMNVQTTTGDPVRYKLLSLPLYMVESLPAAVQYLSEIGVTPFSPFATGVLTIS